MQYTFQVAESVFEYFPFLNKDCGEAHLLSLAIRQLHPLGEKLCAKYVFDT